MREAFFIQKIMENSAILHNELLADPEITCVCIAILVYCLANSDKVISRAEIMKRFKIGKKTYYDSLDILERKGYCCRSTDKNFHKGVSGFSFSENVFYEYPFNSEQWKLKYISK